MHTLYDSDTFAVMHVLANAPGEDAPESSEPVLARHGFEIVDKRRGKEVYLDGSWAEMFQQKIVAWQVNTPTQEEVEDTLESYSGLAQHPVLVHRGPFSARSGHRSCFYALACVFVRQSGASVPRISGWCNARPRRTTKPEGKPT